MKTTTAGLPSFCGSLKFIEPGAFFPTTGAGAISTGGGAGVAHDCQLLGTDRFANGFAIIGPSPPFLEKEDVSGSERALEGMPALRMAIFVVSLANMAADNRGKFPEDSGITSDKVQELKSFDMDQRR